MHHLHVGAGGWNAAELAHWLRDGTLGLIPASIVVLVALALMRRVESEAPIPFATLVLGGLVGSLHAASLLPGALVHGLIEGHAFEPVHAARDAAAGLPFSTGLALVVVALFGMPGRRAPLGTFVSRLRAVRVERRPLFSRIVVIALSLAMVVALPPLDGAPGVGAVAEAAAEAPQPCNKDTAEDHIDRDYSVVAANVILPFNRWGDVDRHGQIFVLEQDEQATTHWMFPLDHPDLNGTDDGRRLRPRPLVLRANEGDCVRVQFKNELEHEAPIPSDDPLRNAARPNPPLSGDNEGLPVGDQYASIHVHGAAFDVKTSDGGNVGFNDDTTVGTTDGDDTITYYWRAPAKEGMYFFHDHATVAGSEADAGSNSHGLWGALAVEPPGSVWHDPVSGAPLYSPTNADPDPTAELILNLNAGGPADTSVVSGELYLDAIIVPGTGASFRESVQISQDEIPGDHLQNCDLRVVGGFISSRQDCTSPEPEVDAAGNVLAGFEFGLGLGFNYGVEPLLVRQEPINRCPDCVGEETWLSSWPYGDPGLVKLASGLGPWYPSWHPLFPGNGGEQNHANTTDPEDCGLQARSPLHGNSCYTANVVHAYQFDAAKIRFLHAGPKETHVFHMHAHQWLSDPFDTGSVPEALGSEWPAQSNPDSGLPEATTIDSQTFGPGEGFTADLLFGAGSRPGTIGDSIFHCHLYPHFAEGFWSLFRTHDVIEDGTGVTPDGVGVRNVTALPDDATPTEQLPTVAKPGYPRFVPGEVGWRAPQPIGGVWESIDVPDDPTTSLVREDLAPATRYVAGQALDLAYLNQIQTVDVTGVTTASEEQQISVTADAGTFTLTFDGATTAAILFNATTAQVEDALQALPGITDVSVTGGAGSWSVTFVDPGPEDVPEMTADASGLSNGVGAGSASVTTVTEGDDGGSYTLEFREAVTTAIPWDSDPESALEALAGIDDVSVSGSPDGWVVTFVAPALNIPDLVADGTGLSSGMVTVGSAQGDPAHPQARLIAALAAEDANTGGSTRGTTTAIEGEILQADRDDAVIPGAPVVDPCPADARQVTYNVSVIQTDIVYNEAGWHDTQGRFYVLTEDVPAILAGEMEPVPFFFRANPGDCLNFNLTNQLPNYLGNDDFLRLVQTNMIGQHIHLVKFDVIASDGASNGWNYQQAAFSEDQMLFNQSLRDGTALGATESAVGRMGEFGHYPAGATATCGSDTFDGLHIDESFVSGVLDANGHGCRIADPEWFNPTWSCGTECPVGQTISERWYVDYDLKTVFTHDHHFPAEDQNRGLFAALVVEPSGMDVRDPFTGEFFQPINDSAHGPVCAQALIGADLALRSAQGLANPPGVGCTGTADGIVLDIIGPGATDDFREFSVAVADFVSLYRDCQPGGEPCSEFLPGQEPLAPPEEPELYPDDDPGIFALNYRNAPLLLRDTRNGVPVDPAYWFSSRVHGDPKTTLFKAYAGDPVRYRVIQGSQEEQHVMQVHGMRWRDEPDDPGSPLVNSTAVGISEAFNFVIPQMSCGVGEDCFGDYLYSTTSTDDLWLGAWGIMRVFGKGVQNLLPLPDNVPQAVNGNTNFAQSGTPPPKANKPGDPCPGTAQARVFDVVAVDAEITYNEFGDHDPYGLVYAVVLPGETPAEAADRVRAGNPSPMVLHVNEGDCVEVTLHNMIDPAGAFATEHAAVGAQQSGNGFDPPLVLEGPEGTPAGLRVSLHASLLQYDVRGSDGAVIGFNRDQTVGPGESILYRWWADDVTPGELGAVNLTDYGDVRGHRHHGLFAGLVVHPAGATVHDPLTGASIYAAASMAKADGLEALADGDDAEYDRLMTVAASAASGQQVDVRIPGREDYRNWSVFFQDGLNLWDANGVNVPDQLDHGALPDAEDRGEKGFNYRNASFHHRFGQQPGEPHDALAGELHRDVFDSTVHGDPATPIFRAYRGDAVRVRVMQGADKPRQHSFMVSGHAWYRQPFDDAADTELIGTIGGISVGRALNIHFRAGGDAGSIGDHRYNCGVSSHHQSGGLWGIARIYEPPAEPVTGAFVPSPLGSGKTLEDGDNPFRVGYTPVMPLELVEIQAFAWDDADIDGSQDSGESPLGRSANGDPSIDGVEFRLHDVVDGEPGNPIGSAATTAASGMVSFSVVPGVYSVKATTPDDWRATTLDWFGADASTQANVPSGAIGLVQLADVSVGVYSDVDNDASLDPSENRLAGWTVTLSSAGAQWTAVTGDGSGTSTLGVATFDGLDPGTYSATVTAMAGRENSTPLPFDIVVPENASLGGPSEPIDVGFSAPSGFRVHLFNDADGDGQQDAGESNKGGWDVTITPTAGGSSIILPTGSDGVADFGDVEPGPYDVTVAYPTDWTLQTSSAERLLTDLGDGSVTGEPTDLSCAAGACTFTVYGPEMSGGDIVGTRSHLVSLGVQNPHVTVVAEPYNDFDNDGVRDGADRKLVGWTAELWFEGAPVATAVTGNDGRAVFYFDPNDFADPDPATGSAFEYTVRFVDPDDAEIPWAPTPAGTTTPTGSGMSGAVSVIAGEAATAHRGFIRLGTLEVSVYHDLDGSASNDDYDPPLAGQTVRLRSRNGQTVLGTKVSDSTGTVAFPVSAGTDYQVEIVVPSGWTQTSPLGSNGSPATRVKLTTSTSLTESTKGPEFGMWQAVDTTPPPTPVFDPAGGSMATPVPLESGSTIVVSSETGSTIWYTTDGSSPDPAGGHGTAAASPASVVLTGLGPVTLQAVAVDGSGNASAVGSAYYDLTAGTGGGGETRTVAPTTWNVVRGSLIAGGPSSLASDNGLEGGTGYLQMGSTRQGKHQVIWAEGSTVAQLGTVSSLDVTWDAIASTGGVTRKLFLWDFVASTWFEIDSTSNEGTSASPPTTIPIASADRYVSGSGEIRFRVETRQKSGYELWIDQLVATVTTDP